MSQYVSLIPWWRTALVRACLALLVGMALAVFFPPPENWHNAWYNLRQSLGLGPSTSILLLWGSGWGLALGWHWLRKKCSVLQTPPALALQGLVLLGMLAALGYGRYAEAAAVPSAALQITITTSPVAKKKGWQARGEMVGGGGVWLYLFEDPQLAGLRVGSVLVLDQMPKRILSRPMATPSVGHATHNIKPKLSQHTGFDFQRYAATQGIHYQASIKPHQYRVLGWRPTPALQTWLARAAHWTFQVLQKHLPQAQDAGLAAALLMGQKQGLDPDLVQAYRATGVLHVIAISGMHLALLASGLQWLLRPLLRWRLGKYGVFAGSLVFVWGFAALTGMGASVVRAALLLSFMALARLQYQRLGLAHATAGAATLLLLWKPLWLLDLGCQLSFAAVLGIGLWARPLEKALPLQNPLLQAAWQVLAASMAAQIFTLPLLLFYFHQFPALFWLGNLVAVPLSGLLLYLLSALVLLAGCSLTVLAHGLGQCIEALLHFLNAFLLRLSQLPFALWETPALTLTQVVALYALLLGFTGWQAKKRFPTSGIGL